VCRKTGGVAKQTMRGASRAREAVCSMEKRNPPRLRGLTSLEENAVAMWLEG